MISANINDRNPIFFLLPKLKTYDYRKLSNTLLNCSVINQAKKINIEFLFTIPIRIIRAIFWD